MGRPSTLAHHLGHVAVRAPGMAPPKWAPRVLHLFEHVSHGQSTHSFGTMSLASSKQSLLSEGDPEGVLLVQRLHRPLEWHVVFHEGLEVATCFSCLWFCGGRTERARFNPRFSVTVVVRSRGFNFRDKIKPLLFRWRVRRPSNHSAPICTSSALKAPSSCGSLTAVSSASDTDILATAFSTIQVSLTTGQSITGAAGCPGPLYPRNGRRAHTIQRTCDDTASWPPRRPADGQQRAALRERVTGHQEGSRGLISPSRRMY